MPFDKPVALITGASSGLGLETAKQLARQDYLAILTARTHGQVDAALADAADAGQVDGRVLDVSQQASVDALFDWLDDAYGRMDVLVNNAGRAYGAYDETLGADAAEITEAFNNNALSAWRMIEKALPRMNQAGYGRIVNLSSGLGALTGMNAGLVPYRLSKTAMNAFTRIASNETGDNVKINSVCPGWVRTALGTDRASRSVEEGAAGIVWAATLPEDGPNGGFFRDGQPIDW